MKKIPVLLLALTFVWACFGCSAKPQTPEAIHGKIEAFIEKEKDEIRSLNDQYAESMAFSLSAEDTNLILSVRYLLLTQLNTESLEASIQNSDSFAAIYKAMKRDVGSSDAKLILRYYDADGNLAYEREIDDSFQPSGKASSAETLEDYVNSETFQSSIAAGGTDELSIKATVENGNTVVIVYALTNEADRGALEEMRANWEESFSAEDMQQNYYGIRTMLGQLFPDETIGLKVRITDPTNETLFEKTFE